MYSCYVHGWSSHHSMCPACGQVVTTTGTIEINKMTEFGPMTEKELNLKFNAPLYSHDACQAKYAEAVKMLEEMAGALESNNLWIKDLPSCNAAYVNNKSVLDKYKRWKAGE